MNPRPADETDRAPLERLWLMFRHDLSAHSGVLPCADGTFRSDRLDTALTSPGWAPYVLECSDRPVGLALVRGLDEPTRVLSEFFVVAGARGRGIGQQAAQDVMALWPGVWEVAFQPGNTGAARFWRRVATAVAGGRWTEEQRPVPGRPDAAPDHWIRCDTGGAASPPDRPRR
ncbi:GNAT family N-acetyltransferase [Streptomyces otsuchiensis]|uniref:GNAT family N-acetyltransferase n=1 Tax=Streptomyces otsuchiensis TaxID=2681388 RepID=UPI001031A507|nr:GNAT family N-acetyltransferase [Streptomyces otsuchiensis]